MDNVSTKTPTSQAPEWVAYTTPPTSVPPLLEGLTGASPATKAAVAAIEALLLEEARLGCLHTAAEVDHGSDHRRTNKAERVWQAARDTTDAATLLLLDGAPASPDDAAARLGAFLRASALSDTSPRSWAQRSLDEAREHLGRQMGGLVNTAVADALRFMMATAAAPPPSSDTPLLALGEEFEARWAEQRAYPIENGDSGYQALDARTDEIADLIRKVPATTMEGLRVKARVVQFCQGDDLSEPVEFTSGDRLGDTVVAASLINDLLGLTERPAAEREAEREAEQALYSRRRGMRMPYDMGSPSAQAWYAARDRYYAAKAASDVFKDPVRDAEDPAGSDMALDLAAEALERWECLPPPSLAAMAEVMHESMAYTGAGGRVWHTADSPLAMRELLDSGRTHAVFAARYYLHTLRLAGSESEALCAVPISGLCPAYEEPDDEIGPEQSAAWEAYHQAVEPYATRRPALVEWWRVILGDPDQRQRQAIVGRVNCRAASDAVMPAPPADEDAIAAAPAEARQPSLA